ncbi:MAG: hypothetical protein QOH06_2055 [Acidobacteriota bacterium]|jgi:hypothetical protein|nr:hypothetical protein [Acidobacteriota bacterium]
MGMGGPRAERAEAKEAEALTSRFRSVFLPRLRGWCCDSGLSPSDSGRGFSDSGTAPSNSGRGFSGSGTAPNDSGRRFSGSGTAPSNSGRGFSGSGTAPSNSGRGFSGSGTAPSNSGRGFSGSGTAPSNSGRGFSDSGLYPSNSGLYPSDSGLYPSDSRVITWHLLGLLGRLCRPAAPKMRVWCPVSRTRDPLPLTNAGILSTVCTLQEVARGQFRCRESSPGGEGGSRWPMTGCT